MIDYILDGVFSKRKVHILAGPSGAGKTTFLFYLISKWMKGEDFLGHKSHPEPFVYVALDRAEDEILNRLEAAGLRPEDVQILSILEPHITIQQVFSQIPGNAKVVFIDGFARLCPTSLNDYHGVANFVLSLQQACIKHDKTIIAVAHSTKVKEGETFLHPRHRVLGSVAWGGFTSTLVFIDEIRPEALDHSIRKVEILPRTAKAEEFYFEMDENGGFVQTSIATLTEGNAKGPRTDLMLLDKLPLETEVKASWITEKGNALGLNYSAIRRLIQKWLDEGVLTALGRGTYRKESSRSQPKGPFGAGFK